MARNNRLAFGVAPSTGRRLVLNDENSRFSPRRRVEPRSSNLRCIADRSHARCFRRAREPGRHPLPTRPGLPRRNARHVGCADSGSYPQKLASLIAHWPRPRRENIDDMVDYLCAQPIGHLIEDERTILGLDEAARHTTLGRLPGLERPETLLRQALRHASNARLPALQDLVDRMPPDVLDRPAPGYNAWLERPTNVVDAIAGRLVHLKNRHFEAQSAPLPTLQLLSSVVARNDLALQNEPMQLCLRYVFMALLRAAQALHHEVAFEVLRHLAKHLTSGQIRLFNTTAFGLLAVRPLAMDEALSDTRTIELMDILIHGKGDQGAKVNAQGTNGGWSLVHFTPLYAASSVGRAAIVRYLLEQGADMTVAAHKLVPITCKQYGDVPEVTPQQIARDQLNRSTLDVLTEWAQAHGIEETFSAAPSNVGDVRSVLNYSSVDAAQQAADAPAMLLTRIINRGSRSVYPLPIGVDLLVENDRSDALAAGKALSQVLQPMVEAQAQCIFFQDFLAAMKRDAKELKAVLCMAPRSAFEDAMPASTIVGAYVPLTPGLKRSFSPVYLRQADAQTLAPVLVHELGHHIGYARGARGQACPASFAALVEQAGIQFQAIPRPLAEIFYLRDYASDLHAGELYTRLYYETPFRLLQMGADPARLAETVEAILPGAVADFQAHSTWFEPKMRR